MEEEEKKIENDIEEDRRETEESIVDEPSNHATNDIKEDLREEGESIDDLKQIIGEKDKEIERLKGQISQINKDFLNRDMEEKRDYNSLKGDIL